jgi:D-serine deaminase-like pyridoxal phosphate-dependent protein
VAPSLSTAAQVNAHEATAASFTAHMAAIRDPYMGDIGRVAVELPTPVLAVDLAAARRNLERMATFLARGQVGLRPHIKVHKSPDAARLQLQAGAHGVASATLWEAAAMMRSGIDDVLIANQVVGEYKIRAVAELAGEGPLKVAVDRHDNAEALSEAAVAAGTQIGILIEFDVGMGRGGVRDTEAMRALADSVANAAGLTLRGVMGYEGHCMGIIDRDERARETTAAMSRLAAAVALLRSDGHACEIVSGGGTGTYFVSAAGPPLTETQAGSYMVMDGLHAALVPEFELAMTVIATVVSRSGSLVVVDAGRKAISADLEPPRPLLDGAEVAFMHEEHMGLELAPEARRLRVGDQLALRPGYGPMTVNLYDVMHVFENGIVVEIWPIAAHYPGRGWL